MGPVALANFKCHFNSFLLSISCFQPVPQHAGLRRAKGQGGALWVLGAHVGLPPWPHCLTGCTLRKLSVGLCTLVAAHRDHLCDAAPQAPARPAGPGVLGCE